MVDSYRWHTGFLELSPHFQALPHHRGFPQCLLQQPRGPRKLESSKHINEEVKAAFDFSYQPAEDPML